MGAVPLDDEDVQTYPTAITNLQLKNMPVYPNGPELLCDISTGLTQPVIPSASANRCLMEAALREICVARPKEEGQPVGKEGMRSLTTVLNPETYPCTSRDICCVREAFQPYPHGPCWTSSLFQWIYLFTITDRYTRWSEAIPLKNSSSIECAHALISTWIARLVFH